MGFNPEIKRNPLEELAGQKEGSIELRTKAGVPYTIEHQVNNTGQGTLETWRVKEGIMSIFDGPDGSNIKIENGHLYVMGVDKGEIMDGNELEQAA